MLNLPYVNQISKNISSVDTFLGLNKDFKIGVNELSESYNMCSDDYPVLSTRKKRYRLKYRNENDESAIPLPGDIVSAVVVNDMLAFLTKTGTLHYDDYVVDLGIEDNKLLCLGNMLYAYPSGTLIKLPNVKDGEIKAEITHTKLRFVMPTDDDPATGIIDEKGIFTGYVFFQPAISSGIGKTAYYIQPIEPKVGDYWYNGESLNMWGDTGSGEMGWVSVEPDCIRVVNTISSTDKETPIDTLWFKDVFKVGDAVFISETNNENIDRSFIIEAFGDENDPAMYLSGYLSSEHSATDCIIEKKMPEKLDFIIEHNNRLWGCFYGYDSEGNFYNEIYATAQNDPTNWYRYDGTHMQSYTISVASGSMFTGVAIINGCVTFFKENYIYRIYGNSPENFQLYTQTCVGVQEGCEDSLVTVNGVTYYKSSVGIMAISDGFPVKISEALGTDMYTQAVAGSDGSKYYIAMYNVDGERYLYMYEFATGIWHIEDCPTDLLMFFNYKNSLFALARISEGEIRERINKLTEIINTTTDSVIKTLSIATRLICMAMLDSYYDICCFTEINHMKLPPPNYFKDEGYEPFLVPEDDFMWKFETGDIGYSYYLSKHVDKICIRAMADVYSRFSVEILYDGEGEWAPVETVNGEGTVKTHIIPIRPNQCDHFKLRFSGIGNVKILNAIIQYAEGGDFT